jgi:hypothetical protein
MERRCSLPRSQEPATCPYPEQDQFGMLVLYVTVVYKYEQFLNVLIYYMALYCNFSLYFSDDTWTCICSIINFYSLFKTQTETSSRKYLVDPKCRYVQ